MPKPVRPHLAHGDRVSDLGAAVRRAVRLGGDRPGPPARPLADVQRRHPAGHAPRAGPVGPVRAVAVAWLAFLRPRLEVLPSGLRGERLVAAAADSGLLRHDIIPVVSGYVVVMSMFVAHRRDRRRLAARGRPDEPITIRGWPPTWPGLAKYLLATALGGYVVFIAVILLYY